LLLILLRCQLSQLLKSLPTPQVVSCTIPALKAMSVEKTNAKLRFVARVLQSLE